MSETMTREVECVLCKKSYSPVIQPEGGKNFYKVHCTSCARWHPVTVGDPVRITLKEVLGLRDEPLALAINTCLEKCQCGGEFSNDAGKRCPECLNKIRWETRKSDNDNEQFRCPWNRTELQKFEDKVFDYIVDKVNSEEETLGQLIDRFESGEFGPEAYMERLEDLQMRAATHVCVIQTWTMMLGEDLVFRAAEEYGLVERYGTRILVSIAQAVETSTGKPVLATLSSEMKNWDGTVQKELRTFLAKIGGGF